MAKARVTVKCDECGAEIYKEKTCGNRTEANDWESWVVKQKWQCPHCWGKAKRAEEAARGLIIDIEVIADIGQLMSNPNGHIRLSFAGDTMPHKDAIKALGYSWFEKHDSGFFGMLSMSKPPKAWQKYVTADEMETELKKALEIGATIGNKPTDMDIEMAVAARQGIEKHKADEAAKKEAARVAAEAAKAEKLAAYEAEKALLEKPVPPEVWHRVAEGKRCNCKIYGKKVKTKEIYCDGVKVIITTAEAVELEKFWTENGKYQASIKALKAKYGIN